MSEASNKTLLKQINSGNIKSAKAQILNFIIEKDGSNLIHLASLLFYKESTVAARLSELEDDGLIYVCGSINNGHHSKWKFEPDVSKQKENALKRLKLKYKQWKAKGEIFNELKS